LSKPLIELVAFSDLHAHNYRYGSKRVPHPNAGGLFNSRLLDCVSVLRDIEKYCVDHVIKHVLFGGDLFHRRSVLHTDVFNVIHREFARMNQLHFTMLPGNHDYSDRTGHIHSLEAFSQLPHVDVLDKHKRYLFDPEDHSTCMAILPVPYTDDREEAKKRLEHAGELAENQNVPTLLLAHLGMQGATVGSDYVLVSDSDIGVADVPYEKFTACLFGHYHQHQQLFRNGWYIGATHQHNWGDANTNRGFLHIRVFDDRIEFVQVPTSAPRFFNIQEVDPDAVEVHPRDFVRYHTRAGGIRDVREVEQRYNNHHVEIIEHNETEQEDLRLPEGTLEPRALVESWVSSKNTDKDSTEAKIALGKELLAEAEDEVL